MTVEKQANEIQEGQEYQILCNGVIVHEAVAESDTDALEALQEIMTWKKHFDRVNWRIITIIDSLFNGGSL
jgi:hypothetical protein